MKKTYMAPQMDVVELGTQITFLNTSPEVGVYSDEPEVDGMNALTRENEGFWGSTW